MTISLSDALAQVTGVTGDEPAVEKPAKQTVPGQAYDGDSIYLDDKGSETRVIGFDAPEQDPREPGAGLATALMQVISEDPRTTQTQVGTDVYDRPLMDMRRGDQKVSDIMLMSGTVHPMPYDPPADAMGKAHSALTRRAIPGARTPIDEVMNLELASNHWQPVPKKPGSLMVGGRKGITRRAWDRGAANLKASLGASGWFLGEKLGFDPLAEWGEDYTAQMMLEAAANPAEVASHEDIDGLVDAGTWAYEKVIENVPNLGLMAAGAGVGGAATRLAAAGMAKTMLKRALTDQAKKALTTYGARAGAFASTYPVHMGESARELKAHGVDFADTDAPYFTAAISTVLDLAPMEGILRYSFKGLKPEMARDVVRSNLQRLDEKGFFKELGRGAAKGAGLGFAVEAPTEVAQELVNLSAVAYHDPDFDWDAPEIKSRLTEAFLAGGVVGATLGGTGRGVAQGVSALGAPRQETPTAPALGTQTADGVVTATRTTTVDGQTDVQVRTRPVTRPDTNVTESVTPDSVANVTPDVAANPPAAEAPDRDAVRYDYLNQARADITDRMNRARDKGRTDEAAQLQEELAEVETELEAARAADPSVVERAKALRRRAAEAHNKNGGLLNERDRIREVHQEFIAGLEGRTPEQLRAIAAAKHRKAEGLDRKGRLYGTVVGEAIAAEQLADKLEGNTGPAAAAAPDYAAEERSPAEQLAAATQERVDQGLPATEPERPESVVAQIEALKASGKSGAVAFFETLDGIPEAVLEGVVVKQAKDGGFYLYREGDMQARRRIGAVQVKATPEERNAARHELLGYQQPKEEAIANNAPVSVVGKTEDGAVVHSEAVDSTKPEVVAAAQQTAQEKGAASVEVMPVEQEIAERQGKSAEETRAAEIAAYWEQFGPLHPEDGMTEDGRTPEHMRAARQEEATAEPETVEEEEEESESPSLWEAQMSAQGPLDSESADQHEFSREFGSSMNITSGQAMALDPIRLTYEAREAETGPVSKGVIEEAYRGVVNVLAMVRSMIPEIDALEEDGLGRWMRYEEMGGRAEYGNPYVQILKSKAYASEKNPEGYHGLQVEGLELPPPELMPPELNAQTIRALIKAAFNGPAIEDSRISLRATEANGRRRGRLIKLDAVELVRVGESLGVTKNNDRRDNDFIKRAFLTAVSLLQTSGEWRLQDKDGNEAKFDPNTRLGVRNTGVKWDKVAEAVGLWANDAEQEIDARLEAYEPGSEEWAEAAQDLYVEVAAQLEALTPRRGKYGKIRHSRKDLSERAATAKLVEREIAESEDDAIKQVLNSRVFEKDGEVISTRKDGLIKRLTKQLSYIEGLIEKQALQSQAGTMRAGAKNEGPVVRVDDEFDQHLAGDTSQIDNGDDTSQGVSDTDKTQAERSASSFGDTKAATAPEEPRNRNRFDLKDKEHVISLMSSARKLTSETRVAGSFKRLGRYAAGITTVLKELGVVVRGDLAPVLMDSDGVEVVGKNEREAFEKAQAAFEKAQTKADKLKNAKGPLGKTRREEAEAAAAKAKTELEIAEHNLNLLRAIITEKPMARVVFLRRGAKGEVVRPYIFISNRFKTKSARDKAVLHEVGHVVLRHFIDSAPRETVKALREALGGADFTAFEENFANAFVNWNSLKAQFETWQTELKDPAEQRMAKAVQNFFDGLWAAMRKLWLKMRKQLEVDETFSDFMQTLMNRGRARAGEKPVAPTTDLGKKIAAGMEKHSGLGSGLFKYRAGLDQSLDLTAPNALRRAAQLRGVRSLIDAGRAGGSLISHLWTVSLKPLDSDMRDLGLGHVADQVRRRPGVAQVEGSGMTIDHEEHQEMARHMRKIDQAVRDHVKTGNKVNPFYKTEYSADLKEAARAMIENRRARTEEAQRLVDFFRDYFDGLFDWANNHHVYIKHRANYLPAVMSSSKLKAEGAKEQFVAKVQTWARTAAAKRWWKNKYGPTARLTEHAATSFANELYDMWLGDQGVLMQHANSDGVYDHAAPGFKHSRKRELPQDLYDTLSEFREDNLIQMAQLYTRALIKRGLWQERHGLNDVLDEIQRRYEARDRNASRYRDEQIEFYSQHGINIYDPTAALKFDLVGRMASGQLSEADYVRVVEKNLPAYQGMLGVGMHPVWRRFQALAMVYQAARVLSLGVFSQMVDIGTVIARTPSGHRMEVVKLLAKMATSKRTREQLRNDADLLGRWSHEVTEHLLNDQTGVMLGSRRIQRFNEWIFRVNGMHVMTNYMRAASVHMGKNIIEAYVNELASTDARVRRDAEKGLAELNVTPAQAQAWVGAGMPLEFNPQYAEALNAVHQFVDESVVQPSPALRPYVGNDQRLAIFFHLKGFIYGFQMQILQRAWNQAKTKWGEEQGAKKLAAAMPLLLLAGFTMPMAALGMELRWLLFPPKVRPEGGFDYFFETAQRAGLPGLAQLMVDYNQAEDYGSMGTVALLGPTASQVEDFIQKDLGDFLPKAVPAYPIAGRLWELATQ